MPKNTATFQLAGGIGNQLFQFVAGLSYASTSKKQLAFDISRIGSGTSKRSENIFEYFSATGTEVINYSITSSRVPKFIDSAVYRFKSAAFLECKLRHVYSSSEIGFDENLYKDMNNSVFRGYFQTYKYFDNLREHGMTITLQKSEYSEAYQRLLDRIDFQNDVAIHIRRGDYLSHSNTIGLLSDDYFRKALLILNPRARVYVFSDEINLHKVLSDEFKIVATPEMSQEHPVETLSLLSKFANLVVSNSTFSWWAASLGVRNKNVIYPDPWFRSITKPIDLVPVGWTGIGSTWNTDHDA